MFLFIGYNSKFYDLPFLMRRIVFHQLSNGIDLLYFDNKMPTLGIYMLHLDAIHFVTLLYNELGKTVGGGGFSLKNVANVLLKHQQKYDYDAVKIRHLYQEILKTQKIDNKEIA